MIPWLRGFGGESLDYYVSSTGNDANDGRSITSAWQTVAQVNSAAFSAGEIIGFRGGDTFSDRLEPPSAGTEGNPIKFRSYSGQATIDGNNSTNAAQVRDDYVFFENLKFDGSDGGTGHYVVDVTGVNGFRMTSCSITGTSTGLAGVGRGLYLDNCANFLIEDTVIDKVNNEAIMIRQTGGPVSSGTIRKCHIGDNGGDPDGQGGDGLAIREGVTGSIRVDDVLFDMDPNYGAAAENACDIKGGGDTLITNSTWVRANDNLLIVHNPSAATQPANVTLKDNNMANTNRAWGRFRNDTTTTLTRCNLHDQEGANFGLNVNDSIADGDNTSLTLNACALYIESDASNTEVLEISNNSSVSIFNTTIVKQNSGSTSAAIRVRNSMTGDLTIRNSILVSNGLPLIETDTAGFTLTLSNNSYYRSDSTLNWFNINGTQYDSSDVPGIFGGTGSVAGDPDFVSEDDTSTSYLLLNAGSPALEIGSSLYLYSDGTDLLGDSFGSTTPNAGCRAGNG